jgi:DNA-binding transcriptional MerR regulator
MRQCGRHSGSRKPLFWLPPIPVAAHTCCRNGKDGLDSTSRRPLMPDIRLSFKDMCAKFDVTPRTLRYYEYIELLTPEKDGRARFYGPRELARMTLILRGRRFGFSLEDIRQWLLIYEKEGTTAQMRKWIELADRQLIELAEQQTQLQDTIAELVRLRDDTARSLR